MAYESTISFSHQRTQNNIAQMLRDHVVVCHLTNHLDVVLLLAFWIFWLQHHKKVLSRFILVCCALCEGWHLARCQVDSALNVACAVVEEEHVGVVFSPEVFEPAHDGYGVEALSLEDGVIDELAVELVEGERNDGPVIDGLVLLFARICCHVGACFNYIIRRNYLGDLNHYFPFNNS